MLWMGIWVNPLANIPPEVGILLAKMGFWWVFLLFHLLLGPPNPLWSASHIHIICIQSVSAPWYAVDGYMGPPLYCYASAGWGGFWETLEPKWWFNVMVEAQTPCGVHSTSISYICKVFQHLNILWMGIWVHPHTGMPVQVGGQFWGSRTEPKSKWWCNVMGEAQTQTPCGDHFLFHIGWTCGSTLTELQCYACADQG